MICTKSKTCNENGKKKKGFLPWPFSPPPLSSLSRSLSLSLSLSLPPLFSPHLYPPLYNVFMINIYKITFSNTKQVKLKAGRLLPTPKSPFCISLSLSHSLLPGSPMSTQTSPFPRLRVIVKGWEEEGVYSKAQASFVYCKWDHFHFSFTSHTRSLSPAHSLPPAPLPASLSLSLSFSLFISSQHLSTQSISS